MILEQLLPWKGKTIDEVIEILREKRKAREEEKQPIYELGEQIFNQRFYKMEDYHDGISYYNIRGLGRDSQFGFNLNAEVIHVSSVYNHITINRTAVLTALDVTDGSEIDENFEPITEEEFNVIYNATKTIFGVNFPEIMDKRDNESF